MTLFRAFIGLILWGVVVYPLSLYAQMPDISSHRGNPLVGLGQSKFVVRYELDGKFNEIELLKSCAYYQSDRDVYGVWLSESRYIDYLSETGQVLRLRLSRKLPCADIDGVVIVIDWQGEDTRWRTRQEILGKELKYLDTSELDLYFVDNLEVPTFYEEQTDKPNSYFSSFKDVAKSNRFNVHTVIMEFVPAEIDGNIYLGYLERLSELKSKVSRKNNFVSFRGGAIPRESWQSNKKLANLLHQIKKPTVLDPMKDERFLPLYQYESVMKRFPRKGNLYGLEGPYVFTNVYLEHSHDGVWDVRSISFGERRIRLNELIVPEKIKAGDCEIDLMKYDFYRYVKYGERAPRAWFYDPDTGLLISFTNNSI